MVNYLKILGFLIISVGIASAAHAQSQSPGLEEASQERLAAASGHYHKARTLLNAAIREFDRGIQFAQPGALIDVEEFRNSLISRSEDLERVLDPQPRISKSGVKFNAYPSIIGEAK